ncbi:MAG: COX15/CtaA family protein, partial [Gammaproteobacteria bacterium]
AGTLGLVVFIIAGLALWGRHEANQPWRLGLALATLVVVQAAFGMWTVTLKLWPQVVTAHLLGGVATLSLLWWLTLSRYWHPPPSAARTWLRRLAVTGLAVTVIQVALGGWVTSNYAALACPDFPTCQGAWWPEMDVGKGFDLAQDIGPNYLGGLVDNDARVAIHVAHRVGALVTTLVLVALGVSLMRRSVGLAPLGGAVLVAVAVQLALGIGNVVWSIPLPVATAHNAGGALLLLVMVTVSYRLFHRERLSQGRLDRGVRTHA